MVKLLNNNKFEILLFFVLISGYYYSKDYGITWDENWHRIKGQENLAYIARTLNLDKILNISESIPNPDIIFYGYGAFFDSICGVIEHVLDIQNKASIFIMRHRVNFTFYMIGIYSFFLFLKSVLKSRNIAFISTMFLLLHPRLLAHGFFNNKDSIAQAILSCALLPIFLTYKKNLVKYAIVAGFICGLAISTRIPTIFLPCIFLVLILVKDYNLKNSLSTNRNSNNLAVYFILSLIISTYAVWPVLWANPLTSFIHIFDTMSHFPWLGINYFMGNFIWGNQIPWQYLPVWIIITTPITFLIFFLIGIITTLLKLYKNQEEYYWFQIFMIFGFTLPISVVILVDSTLYDGWRHIFFIYPFLVYFMSFGFSRTINWLSTKISISKMKITILLAFLTFTGPLIDIINLHPHQQVYFNPLAGKDPMENFEGDYWGASMRQGLEWIMENDNRDSLTIISPEGIIATKNWPFLNEKKQKGFSYIMRRKDDDPFEYEDITNYSGDYYITNFRGSNEYLQMKNNIAYPYGNEVYSIMVKNMKILAIYKLENHHK